MSLLVLFVFASPLVASATERWYLEISETSLDESIVRRTVALELREIEIPPNPLREDDSVEEVSLYVRVAREDDQIYVGLWDRGEYVGRRTISDSGHPKVKARRAGLAIAELARRLRARRLRTKKLLAREAELEEQRVATLQKAENRRALGLRSGAEFLLLPQGAWLAGPSVGLEFNDHFPLRFITQVSWSAGTIGALRSATLGNTSPQWSQFEFSTAAQWVIDIDPGSTLELGALLAAGAVHVGGATQVDGISGQRDTWTARGGLRLGGSRQVTDSLWLHGEFNGGMMLRRIPLLRGEQELRLGGGFLGIALSATLTR